MADEHEKRRQLESLRGRLYERGMTPRRHERTQLKPTVTDAPRAWGQPTEPAPAATASAAPTAAAEEAVAEPIPDTSGVQPIGYYTRTNMPRKRNYRSTLILFGMFFFVIALGISSAYMFLGGNTISGNNIAVSINGPSSIGGGEVIPLQIGVTNQNPATIKAATLILRYPRGTQSPEGEGRELQRETIPLESIRAGETVNVPIRAVIFGEEDERKEIEAEVEYQVEGSNGIFYREAEPLVVTINSSPVALTIESLEQVSSGQPVDVNLIVRSNSGSVLRDLVLRAEYPFGFDFSSAKPEPVSGQNVWLIEELQPGEERTITVRGVAVGSPSDERVVNASVGVASDQNAYRLASVFSTADFQYRFEPKFIELGVRINNDSGETVIVNEGSEVQVNIRYTNPLDTTIYDPEVAVELTGTALDEAGVRVSNGFYDSIRNTVIFDRNTSRGMEQLQPGDTVLLSFSLSPDSFVRQTPDMTIRVNAKGRRVQENNVPEELVGTEMSTVRFASQASLLSSASPQNGPVPPVAERMTQYTISMRVESGSNELVDGEVSATLPTYVSWLDLSSGDGSVSFRSTSRTVVWDVGDVDDNSAATVSFTVGFLPSISQVGTTPTLVSSQSLRATDRFTGTVVRDSAPAVTTALTSEAGYGSESGEVRRSEDD